MFSNESTRETAQRVLDFINANPAVHRQTTYFGDRVNTENYCGTTMCVAGTALYVEYGINSPMSFYEHPVFGRRGNDHTGNSYAKVAGPLLGFENADESDAIFYEMDNERAVQKLKHLVTGDLMAFDAMIEEDIKREQEELENS